MLLNARMRTAAGWSDACILNISSRGVMVHAGRPFVRGSTIELRHGDHVIVGRVVWRDGSKAGLQAEQRLPVEQILSLANGPQLRLTAGQDRRVERRRRPRTHEQSRIRSRAFEFASVLFIVVLLSGSAFALVGAALAKPLAQVRLALGGG